MESHKNAPKAGSMEDLLLQCWECLSEAGRELVSARKALGLSAHEEQRQLFQIKMVQAQAERNIEYWKSQSPTKRYL